MEAKAHKRISIITVIALVCSVIGSVIAIVGTTLTLSDRLSALSTQIQVEVQARTDGMKLLEYMLQQQKEVQK